MKYTCVGCGAEFEAEPSAALRCPKCQRRHGLEPEVPDADGGEGEAGAAPPPASGRARGARYAVYGGVLVAAVAVVVGAVLATRHAERMEAESAGDEQLRRAIVARGVPTDDVVLPFSVDPGVTTLGRDHAVGGTPLERAQALARAVRQLLDQAKARRWVRQRLPEEPPRRAMDLLSALRGGTAGDVRSYEVATLTLAAARAAGLHTLLAEVAKQNGRYADPSGSTGAYAVAVYAAPPRAGAKPLGYVDAFGDGTIDDATPLDDVAAVAGFYVLRALSHCNAGDSQAANRDADVAAKLAPASPLPLVARGQAFIVGGGGREAIGELRQAAQKRDDAPRQTNLAAAYIAAQEPEQAEAALRAALQRDPGFGPAHLALAALLTMRRDDEAAKAELDAAERIDPNLVGLRLVRAQMLARKGDLAAAEKEVRTEVAADPGDERAGLMLFGLLKAGGKSEEAERVKEDLLKRSRQPDRLRGIIDAAEGREPEPAPGVGRAP